MNKSRRKEIQEAYDSLADIREIVESIHADEEEYKENMPENLQDSEKAQYSEEKADQLQSAIDSMDEALSELEEAKQ